MGSISIIKRGMCVLNLPPEADPLSQLLLFGLTLPCAFVVASVSEKRL